MNTWLQTQRLHSHVNRFFAEALRMVPLSPVEAVVLAALYECDGQRATDLANVAGRAPTSFTPNLDALVDKGFIRRAADDRDRRTVRLYLTPQARALRDVIQAAMEVADNEAAAFLAQWAESLDAAPVDALAQS